MKSLTKLSLFLIWLPLTQAFSQQIRPVGLEFEYSKSEIANQQQASNMHLTLLSLVKKQFPGNKTHYKKWTKYTDQHDLFYAYYADSRYRIWSSVPEITIQKEFTDFELITPPLSTQDDIDKLARTLDLIMDSGLFIEGESSSTHFTFDINDLIKSDDNISDLVDLILFLENHILEIYNLIKPQRYGLALNFFAVPLAFDQRELLHELAALPKNKRTYRIVQALFLKYDEAESALANNEVSKKWKYRAFNYGKIFKLGPFLNRTNVIEVRLPDLLTAKRFLHVHQALQAMFTFGPKTHTRSFIDPFKSMDEYTDFNEVSDFIKKSLTKSKYLNFLNTLKLSIGNYPPYDPNLLLESSNSCLNYLN